MRFHTAPERRRSRRLMVGDVPVGVDGRQSTSLMGEPILAVEHELAAAG